MSRTGLHRVVVVGAGAAGLSLASALAREAGKSKIALTLVDPQALHDWKPRWLDWYSHPERARAQRIDLRRHARQLGYQFVEARCDSVDPENQQLQLCFSDGRDERMAYDSLVLAVGSRSQHFDLPGVAEHARFIESAADVVALRKDLSTLNTALARGRRRSLDLVIVGAGPTGVELAGEIASHLPLSRSDTGRQTPSLSLIDASNRLLPGMQAATSRIAARNLSRAGVRLLLGRAVERLGKRSITLADGERLPASRVIWVAGLAAPAWLRGIPGAAITRDGRIEVDPYLQARGLDSVYVAGDCARMQAQPDLPATAQLAEQQGAYLAQALLRQRRGGRAGVFRYSWKGTIVPLAHGEAASEFPTGLPLKQRVATQGRWPMLLYQALGDVHQAQVAGFRGAAQARIDEVLARLGLSR